MKSLMAKKHLKKCSKSLDIRKVQIKMTLIFQLIPIRIAKIKNKGTPHAGKDVEQEEHSYIASGDANLDNHYGNQFGSLSKNWK